MTLNTQRRARAGAAPSAQSAKSAKSAKAVTAVKAVTAKSRSRRAVQQLVCTAALVALAAAIPMSSAFAQGIPVLDTANLVSAIQRLQSSITQINNQYQQIRQLHEQVNAMSRARGLGEVLNNPALHNYIPRDAAQIIQQIERNGYSGLSGAARALRDAEMVYNCLDLNGSERVRCQAALSRPYQGRAFMDTALRSARQRSDQINALMRRAGASQDLKEAAELQARIAAEGALLQHEVSQIQLMRGLAEADQRIDEARAREAQLQQVSRTRRLADFWGPTP
jgi:type IV secretion system protein VirB5